MKKHAFTMAELLMSIGIIGVLCTLCLPVVKNTSWEMQRNSLIKTNYSKLTEALNLAIQELEFVPKCMSTDSTACKLLGDTMVNKILVVKQKCEKNAASGGCVPKYSTSNDDIIAIDCFKTANIKSKNYVYVLSDGMILISCSDKYFNPGKFAIDINGYKGPNKWGYDLYPLKSEFAKDGKKLVLNGIDMTLEADKSAININDILSHKK